MDANMLKTDFNRELTNMDIFIVEHVQKHKFLNVLLQCC